MTLRQSLLSMLSNDHQLCQYNVPLKILESCCPAGQQYIEITFACKRGYRFSISMILASTTSDTPHFDISWTLGDQPLL